MGAMEAISAGAARLGAFHRLVVEQTNGVTPDAGFQLERGSCLKTVPIVENVSSRLDRPGRGFSYALRPDLSREHLVRLPNGLRALAEPNINSLHDCLAEWTGARLISDVGICPEHAG